MRLRQQHIVRKVEVWVGVKSVRESVCVCVCLCVHTRACVHVCPADQKCSLRRSPKLRGVAFRSRLIYSDDDSCTLKCSLHRAAVSSPSLLHE